MPRPLHFTIGADNPKKASKFYSDVFGWRFNEWEGGQQEYWLIETGEGEPGINGGMMQRGPNLSMTTVNTLGVPSVEACMERVEQNGGKVTMGKTRIPGTGYFAYCEDTEGNPFGIFETYGSENDESKPGSELGTSIKQDVVRDREISRKSDEGEGDIVEIGTDDRRIKHNGVPVMAAGKEDGS